MITPRVTRLIRASDLRIFQAAVVDSIPDGWAARSTAVVVPGRSAAEELRRTIEDRRLSSASGGAIILPDLVSRGELYDELHVHLRDAPAMLSEFEREVLLRLAADDARAEGVPPPFNLRPGLVAAILSFYDELRRRSRTVDSLDRIVGEKLAAGRDVDRGAERLFRQTQFLAATFAAFERRVGDSGRIDEQCVGNPIEAKVTVNPMPFGFATPPNQSICSGDYTGISLIPGSVKNTVFTWTSTNIAAISGNSSCLVPGTCGLLIEEMLLNSTQVGPLETYTITAWANGCSGGKFVQKTTVQSGTPKKPAITGQFIGICPAPSTYTYTATGVAAFNDVNWYLPAGCTLANGYTLNSNPIVISYPAHWVPGYKPIGGSDFLQANVTSICGIPSLNAVARPTPTGGFTITGSKIGLCDTAGKVFYVANYPGLTYNWSVTPGSGITITSASNMYYITAAFASDFTSGTITCAINGSCGPQYVNLAVAGKPSPIFSVPAGLGSGCMASIGATGYSTQPPTWLWTISGGGTIVSASSTQWWVNVVGGTTNSVLTVQESNTCGTGTMTKTIAYSGTSCARLAGPSVADPAPVEGIRVYPNPAKDNLHVEFSSNNESTYKIELIDITGRTVLKETNKAMQGNNLVELNLHTLSKGLYMLSVTTDNAKKLIKLTVE